MKKIFFVILLLSFTSINYSQTTRFDSLITAGINQIYSIQFDKAESTFKLVRKVYPQKPQGLFFDAMIDWWRILLNLDNEDLDDEFYDKLDNVIDFCDDNLDDNPENIEAIFFKGGALGFRGRLLAIRESWFKAALDAKDALPLVFKAYELDSTNVDVKLGFGIYNYYASVIPEKYPVVKPFMIFFPEGNKEKGLEQLKFVAENGKYAKIEAKYFLMILYYQYEEDYQSASKYAEILLKQFPDNPAFQRYYGRIYIRQNDYVTGAKIFGNILAKCNKNLRGYNKNVEREASYYLGMKYKNANQPDSARVYFELSEKISRQLDVDEESGFLINTVLYLGMIYDQLGMRDKAIEYYKKVLDFRERSNSHEQAEQYLKKPYK